MAKKETNTELEVANCDIKQSIRQLEITICDIKLGRYSKTALCLHPQWHRHAQQCIKV